MVLKDSLGRTTVFIACIAVFFSSMGVPASKRMSSQLGTFIQAYLLSEEKENKEYLFKLETESHAM